MSGLLRNAIESIQLGIEDYQLREHDARRLHSAFRNFHAGILLLCKEVLLRLCPADSNELHIKVRQKAVRKADGTIVFVGDGNSTISEEQIKSRFKDLGIKTDLSTLGELSKIRNKMEHYCVSAPISLMQQAFSAALPIVHNIIVEELKEEPVNLLGRKCWAYFSSQAEIHNKQKRVCKATFDGVDLGNETLACAVDEFLCTKCGSDLIKVVTSENAGSGGFALVCADCGQEQDAGDLLFMAVQRRFFSDA